MEATLQRETGVAETNCPKGVSMKTGSDVLRNGLYASECCLKEAGLIKDQSFPRCPKCLGLTVWMSVQVPRNSNKPKKAA
jgi:hypothetical protein